MEGELTTFLFFKVNSARRVIRKNGFLLGRHIKEPWELGVLSVWAGINCGSFISRRLSFGWGYRRGEGCFFPSQHQPV